MIKILNLQLTNERQRSGCTLKKRTAQLLLSQLGDFLGVLSQAGVAPRLIPSKAAQPVPFSYWVFSFSTLDTLDTFFYPPLCPGRLTGMKHINDFLGPLASASVKNVRRQIKERKQSQDIYSTSSFPVNFTLH